MSEAALRRALAKIDEAAGLAWLERHLDYGVGPLLSAPWILDVDMTIKPLYAHQAGAALIKDLKGRVLKPPGHLLPAPA